MSRELQPRQVTGRRLVKTVAELALSFHRLSKAMTPKPTGKVKLTKAQRRVLEIAALDDWRIEILLGDAFLIQNSDGTLFKGVWKPFRNSIFYGLLRNKLIKGYKRRPNYLTIRYYITPLARSALKESSK